MEDAFEDEALYYANSTNNTFYFTCMVWDRESDFFWFVVNGILLNVLGFFGVLGNIISMIILSRPQMRSGINYLLIGLARVDTVLILTSILLFGLMGIYPYTGYLFTYYYKVAPRLAFFVYPLATVAQTASVYLTVSVSFDRYVAVCKPLRARSLCTYGRARIYVICILIFSVIYNLPKLWETQIRSDFHPTANMTVYCNRPTAFRNDPIYQSVYINWCYLIFIYLIPFLALAFLNNCIYTQIRIANRERALLSRNQRREIGLATMLLCVVMVFFGCNILPLVINIIEVFELPVNETFLSRMIKTSNLLVTVNSSVNFIIYVTFGEKFKRLFLVLFCSNGLFGTGKDSPEITGHDDSFISNGDRQSMRLHRHNTNISRNGTMSLRHNGSVKSCRDSRARGNTPAPCVYYPGSKSRPEISTVGFTTQTSVPASEWNSSSTNTF